MKLVGHYKRSELAHLNFVGGEHEDGTGNAICDAAGVEVYAPDFDGTTDGRSAATGWNCLVLRADVDAWKAAASSIGADVYEARGEIEPGHYGDGNWRGVDLCADPRDSDAFYWIDLEAH